MPIGKFIENDDVITELSYSNPFKGIGKIFFLLENGHFNPKMFLNYKLISFISHEIKMYNSDIRLSVKQKLKIFSTYN